MPKRSLILIFGVLLFSRVLYGQETQRGDQKKNHLFEVSGVVLDSNETPLPNIRVNLIAASDTLMVETDAAGVFIFKRIKNPTFHIKIEHADFYPFVKKYFFNDEEDNIVLDPVLLSRSAQLLDQVVINGQTRIVYKTDTVEYRASNYKVRENASVDELLKKMEGVTVERNGELSYLGQPVNQLRLNGKRFADGNVSENIRTLPAEIVEKIQFIDDYGVLAARTGVKNTAPVQVLNITTLADKSIAHLARTNLGMGSRERYEGRLFLQRLNANEQWGLNGNLMQTLNGVAQNQATGTGAMGASFGTMDNSGTSRKQKIGANYRNQWGNSLSVTGFYRYAKDYTGALNLSRSEIFSSNGTTTLSNHEQKKSDLKNHQVNLEVEFNPDSTNFLKWVSDFSQSGNRINTTFEQAFTGFQNQQNQGTLYRQQIHPIWSNTLFYQHIFHNPKRHISVSLDLLAGHQDDEDSRNNHLIYLDSGLDLIKDSLLFLQVNNGIQDRNYKLNVIYVEPISTVSRMEFSVYINRSTHYNTHLTDSLTTLAGDQLFPIAHNRFIYRATETRLALHYHLIQKKNVLSVGLSAIPVVLNHTVNAQSMGQTHDFNLVPVFNYEHIFSRTRRISVFYSGSVGLPMPLQMQTFSDQTDPLNITVGNPDLKPTFNHLLSTTYRHFLPYSRINISLQADVRLFKNKVVPQVRQLPLDKLPGFYNLYSYMNTNGAHSWNLRHTLSKALFSDLLSVGLEGSFAWSINKVGSNAQRYNTKSWIAGEAFSVNIQPLECLEINSSVAYNQFNQQYEQPGALNSKMNNLLVSADATIINKGWKISLEAGKNYVHGIGYNLSKNPFVMNAYLEKALAHKNNAILRLEIFDLFKQNNLLNQMTSYDRITFSPSNVLSRYLFLSFQFNLQQWGGTPKRNGKEMKRRGDGSFIH